MLHDRLRIYSERKTPALLLAVALGAPALTAACSAPPKQVAVKHCSEILKIWEIQRPLAWGERTLDEAAAHIKYRRELEVQTVETKSNNQAPVGIDLLFHPEAVNYDVGGQYCTISYVEAPKAASEK